MRVESRAGHVPPQNTVENGYESFVTRSKPPGIAFLSSLDERSEKLLDSFAQLGEQYGRAKSKLFGGLSTVTQQGLSAYSNARDVERGLVEKIRQNPTDVVSRYESREVKTAPKFRFLARVATGFDAVTGIFEAAHTFHLEREAGATRYPKTAKAFATSTLQIMAGGAVGTLAFTAASVGAPAVVALGGAIALGAAASYGVSRAANWIFG